MKETKEMPVVDQNFYFIEGRRCKYIHEVINRIPHFWVRAYRKPDQERIEVFECVMNGNAFLSITDSGWRYKKDEIIAWEYKTDKNVYSI